MKLVSFVLACVVLALCGCGPEQPATPHKLTASSAEFISPVDANGVYMGVSSYPKFQDGAASPLVSPQTGATLTLTRPSGAIRLHVSCTVAYDVGEGTLAGTTTGNGYVAMAAGQWWGTECAGLTTISLKTAGGGSGTWYYCWDMYKGN